MFSSLKVRNYRLYWSGMLVSLTGTWVQSIAQSWLVFELTNSSFLLGLVGFLSTIPVFILSLFAGVTVDRVDKRRILFVTQTIFMFLALILAVLAQFKWITAQQIMVIAFFNGVVMAFDAPCRQSIVVELVGREYLMNAIALNSAAFNSARIIGPALAGILISVIGMSGCFYLNAASFLAVIAALFMIKLTHSKGKSQSSHFFQDLLDGLKFIKQHKIILVLMSIVGINSLFGISYMVLMPVYASEVFGMGAKGLGLLMSSVGIGALAGALTLAKLGDFPKKGKIMLSACFIFSIALLVFSLSKSIILTLSSLAFVGWASVSAISVVNTLLQTLVPDNFRGRIMSAFMFTFAGILPFGNLIAGSFAHFWGAAWAVCVNSIICLVFFVLLVIFFPRLWEL